MMRSSRYIICFVRVENEIKRIGWARQIESGKTYYNLMARVSAQLNLTISYIFNTIREFEFNIFLYAYPITNWCDEVRLQCRPQESVFLLLTVPRCCRIGDFSFENGLRGQICFLFLSYYFYAMIYGRCRLVFEKVGG